MDSDSKLAALRRGMLEPLVLASIVREANFPVQEGTLYPLLNKLRRDGLVAHQWQESPSGPPRKYLSLTEAGRGQLAQFRSYWGVLTDIIETIGR